jgi:hypothetical protein
VVEQDNTSAQGNEEIQRLRLLENNLEFAFEHGKTGENMINDIPFQVTEKHPHICIQ